MPELKGNIHFHMFTAIFTGGFADNQIALERAAALHYQGQSFELEVPMPAGTMDRAALAALEEQPAIPSACGEPRPGVCFKLAEDRIDLRRVDRTDQYLSRSCEVISDVYRRVGGRLWLPPHRRLAAGEVCLRRLGWGCQRRAHRWDSSSKIRFAPDSPLEGDGFELSVPGRAIRPFGRGEGVFQ